MTHDRESSRYPPGAPNSIAAAQSVFTIDVSGDAGSPGRDGTSLARQVAPTGRAGRSGGDAGRAAPGQNAGEIAITLRSSPTSDELVEVHGRVQLADGRGLSIQETLRIAQLAAIQLIARGGQGGAGGAGGDGEKGGPGRDGTPATRSFPGGDGGPGFDGGDGGRGTDGERGGDGGHILVAVDERDLHLLMLLEHDFSGGPGGAPGSHGHGGAGGDGGKGGESYSWTTTANETYQDPDGTTRTRTVTQRHHQPGGGNGPQGRAGRASPGVLQAGAPGHVGSFRIAVSDRGRVAHYSRRYDVELASYELALDDGFAEPGTMLRLRKLTVENSGGMPTPSRFPVEIRLAAGRWAQPEHGVLAIPPNLFPGERYTFETSELTARVPELGTLPSGQALREIDRVQPIVVQPGVDRPFANRHEQREFTIAFAGELEGIRSLESQTSGQAAWVRIQVVNRSRRGLGSQSDSRRKLLVRLTLRNSEVGKHLMLLDALGRQVPWDPGFEFEIPELASGASTSVACIVGVLPGVVGYLRAELVGTLWLASRDQPASPVARQECPFVLRIGQAYRFDPQADLLFIANHSTTREEKAAWEVAASRLGKRINIWDISLNDALSLSDELAHGDSLLRDFHGKTLILSNGPFATSAGTRYGDQFLSQMDLIKAAESHGIRTLIINDEAHELAHLFRERMIPTDGEPEFRYSSIKAFQQTRPHDQVPLLLDQVRELVERGAKAAQADPLTQTSEISLWGIRSPREKRLRRQAERLQRQLEAERPGRRYAVMYRLPEATGGPSANAQGKVPDAPSGWFFNYDQQGILTVMPTVGDAQPNLVVVESPADQIHSPEFILGSAVQAGLLQSLSFQEKVNLLDERLRDLAGTTVVEAKPPTEQQLNETQQLIDAILVDLATEQAAVLKFGWRPLAFGKTLEGALEKHRYLATYPFRLSTLGPDSPEVSTLARLVAGMEFLGRNASRWYEAPIFPWSFWRRGPALRRKVLVLASELARSVFGRVDGKRAELVAAQVRKFEEELQRAQRKRRLERRRAAREVVLAPLSRQHIRTDASTSFPRVLSLSQWQAIRKSEHEREDARQQLQREKQANRATFQLVHNGHPLPHAAESASVLQPFLEACRQAAAKVPQLDSPVPITGRQATRDLPPSVQEDGDRTRAREEA